MTAPVLPPESLKLRVLEAARRRPAPARPDRATPALAVAGLAAAATGAVVQWGPVLLGDAGGLAHAAGRPAASGAGVVAGTVALALAATLAVLPRRGSMLSPPRGLLLAVAVLLPAAVGAWLVLWGSTYVDPFARLGWRCFTLTAMTAPWPFAALVFASRRTDPRHPGATGAALGAVAGAWAAAMVELWCPLAAHAHVLLGHVLPLGAIVLAGAGIGARLFRLRRV